MKRSANVVHDPVAPTRWRSTRARRCLPGPLAAREDEAQLDLHVRARATVVDHRAVGADPDVAGHAPAGVALGVGAEDGLGACPGLGFDASALLGHPGVEPAVTDPDGAQLVERPGGLGIGELGDEEEGPLPDAEGVLGPGRQAEQCVEGHDLLATGQTALAAPGEGHLAGQGHDPTRRPTVALQEPTAADVTARHGQQRLEGAHDLAPDLATRLGQRGPDGPLQRADVSTLRMQLHGERDRDGDRLHGEPFPMLVPTTSSLRMGLTPCPAGQHRRLDAYAHAPNP